MKANILHTLRSLHNDESGQDLIEYALVAALIAFAAVTTMQTLATNINKAFSKISSQLAASGATS
jgi:pilus assembly protein Flp/PilA